MIKLSAGTAHVLGLKKLRTDALPTTAYLMKGEKCTHDCGFCPQAKGASSRADLLSRITWAQAKQEDIFNKVADSFAQGKLKRACLQVVDGQNQLNAVVEMVQKLKSYADIPLCVSTRIKNKTDLMVLADAGVERIGIALDGACDRVYKATKTGNWRDTLARLEEASRLLPGRISTHLIVGLGETEEEMVQMFQKMHDWQVTVGLFAFTPVAGTRMANVKPPALAHYRRLQAANYLIKNNIVDAAGCSFVDGRLTNYGMPTNRLTDYLKAGQAFQTSGCPDCNRPYYNEKPGGDMYNYPRPLQAVEIADALKLLTQSLQKEVGQDG